MLIRITTFIKGDIMNSAANKYKKIRETIIKCDDIL